jgi:hypothetical protein
LWRRDSFLESQCASAWKSGYAQQFVAPFR